MVKNSCAMLALVCITFLVIVSSPHTGVEADKLIGSCVWGAVDYTSNCNSECKRRGFRGGHCGSFANVNCCCSSEDESGATKTPAKCGAGHRRGARRVRRRRAMPMHCVTLQAPMPERCSMIDLSEKPKDVPTGRLYKTSSETNCENLESQSTTSVAMTSTDPVDETWRGGYATAASRRRMMTACSWGNGVRWDRGVGRVGQWVRIYPHALPKDDQLSLEDARESVAHVSKLLRAAREVAREGGRDKSAPRDGSRDAFLEAALHKKLQYGSTFEVWLPPF